MSADLAFQPGDRCGQYRIIDLLSSGGIGEVYRAEQPSVGRQVAIKCLQFRHANREDLQARMAMEGQALGRISHPNMVTVFDAGCSDRGVIWIAMELLVGETLRHILNDRGRLEVTEAVSCAVDVAEAVGAAHREGIVHRDIKPENVFVTEHGAVKVLDLGTAKLQGWGDLKTTEKGRILGTPAYLSPEQIRCVRVDERSDIYALGVMLYEMIAVHPFAHRVNLADHYELARMHLFGDVRPLPDVVEGVSDRLDAVVRKAMAKEPSHRYATMLELANELRTAIGLVTPVIRASVRPKLGAPAGGLGPHGTVRIAKDAVPAARAVRPAGPSSGGREGAGASVATGGPTSVVGTAQTEVSTPAAWWIAAILAGGLMGGGIGGAVLFWPSEADGDPAQPSAPTSAAAASPPAPASAMPTAAPAESAVARPAASASATAANSWPTPQPVVRTAPGKDQGNKTKPVETNPPPPPATPPKQPAAAKPPSTGRRMPSSGL